MTMFRVLDISMEGETRIAVVKRHEEDPRVWVWLSWHHSHDAACYEIERLERERERLAASTRELSGKAAK